ncbi:hypothetical protein [Halopelagius inordinatus]|uniref:hypothetical protein n=1 Tax=Halopelagius inordinatus TaxID=553467 RepID=UPI0011607B91|nr:hypothetical protein [Halopelagius inordinatus]
MGTDLSVDVHRPSLLLGHELRPFARLDFATDPDDAREVAEGVGRNAEAIEMGAIGHFPMSENPEPFKQYLKPVLGEIRSEGVDVPEQMTPESVGVDLEESGSATASRFFLLRLPDRRSAYRCYWMCFGSRGRGVLFVP